MYIIQGTKRNWLWNNLFGVWTFFDVTTYILDNYDLRNDYPNAIILYFFEHKAFDIYGKGLAGVANDIVFDNAVIFAET